MSHLGVKSLLPRTPTKGATVHSGRKGYYQGDPVVDRYTVWGYLKIGERIDREEEEEAERKGGEIGSGLRFRSRIWKKRNRDRILRLPSSPLKLAIALAVAAFRITIDRGGFAQLWASWKGNGIL